MNVDAAVVMRELERQPVARQARTLAKLCGLSEQRTRGALILLGAIGKASKTANGCWSKA